MAKVTVIIPLYNQLHFRESLESILEQTYPDIEIIAVSATPTDDNFKALLDKYKVMYLETTDTDYLQIINKALGSATGEIIAYLNEGDTFSPEKIELQVKTFNDDPDAGLVITAYQTIKEDGSVQNTVYIPEFTQHDVLFVLLYGYIFNRSTAIFRRECYQQAMQYNDNMKIELELWIQIAKRYKVGVINKPLVKTRVIPIRKDIQKAISRSMDSTPLEEIFPSISSVPENSLIKSCAYAVKGVILMRQGLYKDAMDSFTHAHQLCPSAMIPQIWMGMLSFQAKDYESTLNYLAEIPMDDAIYLDAQWITTLATESQNASHDTQGRINVELGKQYNILLQKTLDIIHGKCLEPYDVVEEARLYLNLDIPQVIKALFNGTRMIADEWNQKSPNTPDEVVEFYKDTGNYIFELAWWHRDPLRVRLTTTAIEICNRNDVRKVLDFGCGIGQDGILLSSAGFDVTLADLPGKTFDFAQWRVKRSGLNINIVNSDELSDNYDAITCFDVLEHVWEPKEIVTYLYEHLSDNGILLVTTSFEQRETHPLHLERNAKYSGKEFIKMMDQVRFIMEREYKRPLVFRKSKQILENCQ